jgi:type III pantothenate kinase
MTVPLLCANIGNSRTTLGLVSGGEVLDHWRVATEERRTADEWGVLIRNLVGSDIRGLSVCSAVPTVLHEWRQMMTDEHPDVPHVVVEPGVKTGLPVLMDNPREVGSDRIVNAIAAARLYEGPSIVVAFGTATTFEVITPRGEYVGGAIAPGIEISMEALGRRGAQLRMVELVRPRSVVAKNTVEAVQSGVLFGTAAQVDGMVGRITAAMGVPPHDVNVIATGSLAPLVVEECASVTDHEPHLTMLGLEIVFDRNT